LRGGPSETVFSKCLFAVVVVLLLSYAKLPH
jgi:hypothetical protein